MTSRAYRQGWFAPMEDDQPGHPAVAAAAAGGRRDAAASRWTEVDAVVVGLGGIGSAPPGDWPAAARRRRARAVRARALRGASHDTSRILRHSYHTPGYVRLAGEAYDDWSRASSTPPASRW